MNEMIRIINEPKRENWANLLKRPTNTFEDLETLVTDIFNEIEQDGDIAVKKYTKKFDNIDLMSFDVSEEEIKSAEQKISSDLKEAIQLASKNIEAFHRSQKLEITKIITSKGVECWQESRGIERVGIYIPGGTAPLFSTVLMLGIPSKIAGCKEIILCSPPDKSGNINPAILYSANLVGITKIFKVGGIQAIGAMTFGTETIPRVYKIFGPGNQFVTVAKQIAQNNGIAIDMPAGPSELLVLADETSNPQFVASDLLSQAEHGTDSQVVCVSNNTKTLIDIAEELNKQLEFLPRKEIAKATLTNSKFILLKDKQDIIDLVNEYAPEHFIIATKYNDFYIENIVNVGSVFIGDYTPESAGDYASGTNHTLPTDGFAKAYSGVNLDSFVKKITFQKISKEGILEIGKAIEIMAEEEGLFAHKNAVTVRLNSLKQQKDERIN